MSRTTIKKAISLGVSKINFGTEVRYKYIEYFQEAINTIDHKGHSWKISEYASDRLKEDIKEIIKLSGSANKA
jgi:fructose/tagatose bisphosphate aldolase